MTGYLLDTNILSALAPGKTEKPPISPMLDAWMRANTENLYLSAITAIEIEAGLLKLGRTAPGRWHGALSNWFATVLTLYADRILSLDLQVARVAAALTDRSKANGEYPGLADISIAATAVAHDMIVLTRNSRHFDPLGVRAMDPFVDLTS